MKFILYTIFFALALSISQAQDYTMTDGVTETTCSGTFKDDGGNGFYSNGIDYTYTICSDGASTTLAVYFTGSGNFMSIDNTDTLFIYDGNDTNASLIGAYNNSNPADSVFSTGTCLTFQFVSDGASNGLGWEADIECNYLCQPIQVVVSSTPGYILTGVDTGLIEFCTGDSVFIDVNGLYPLNGTGYNQSDATSTFSYSFGNDPAVTGVNLTSQTFFAEENYGNFITMTITDSVGCVSDPFVLRAQVGPTPDFSQIEHGEDTICLGDTIQFIGGVLLLDTVNLTAPIVGNMNSSGVVAGTTFLPDGSGDVYTTSITMNSFNNGQLVQNPTDIQMICMDIEHSYLGDLEIWLECPNGTEVSIVNSYSPDGYLPGGFGGGGTFLGEPIDDDSNLNPGVGYEYCFSLSQNTWGTMGDELGAGNTVPVNGGMGNAMNPDGIYMPDGDYSDFVGCPLNGEWTLFIQDNIGSDNGYIFEWGIILDPSLLPDNEYFVDIDSTYWWDNEHMVSKDDTSLVYVGEELGLDTITFTVVDTYGCAHDTSFIVMVMGEPTVNLVSDTTICGSPAYELEANGTDIVDYLWSTSATTSSIQVSSADRYIVTVSNQCGSAMDSTDISLYQAPQVSLPADDTLCDASDFLIDATYFNSSGPNPSISWSNGETTEDITVSESGDYILTVTNGCTGMAVDDTISLTFISTPTITMPSDTTICRAGVPFEPVMQNQDEILWNTGNVYPEQYLGVDTIYTCIVSNYCGIDSAKISVNFHAWPGVWINQEDTIACNEATTSIELSGGYSDQVGPNPAATWSTGEMSNSITVTNNGTYYFTATNGCPNESATDSVVVDFVNCEVIYPNIITPNGDGYNDYLVLDNLEHYTNVHLEVYNRWGKRVFEDFNYQNDWKCTVKQSDRLLKSGTYYYVVTIPTDTEPIVERKFFKLISE